MALTLPAELGCNVPTQFGGRVGVFHPSSGGFAIEAGGSELTIEGPEPAIPDGTFVGMVYVCVHQTMGDLGGQFVVLFNVPSFQGALNPTEDGSRVWLILASGGPAPLPDQLPFAYALEQSCAGLADAPLLASESLIFLDPKPPVVVAPGEKGRFVIAKGPHAGAYEAENVNIVYSTDKDNPVNVNFIIQRAD